MTGDIASILKYSVNPHPFQSVSILSYRVYKLHTDVLVWYVNILPDVTPFHSSPAGPAGTSTCMYSEGSV